VILDFTHKSSEGVEELQEAFEKAFLLQKGECGKASQNLAQAS
jgi:hypothetical protein